MTLKPPISFVYGNCVFGRALDDGWAAFAVQTSSYQWLSEDGKRARLLELLGAIEAVEADLQIVRVSRVWELDRYVVELDDRGGADEPHQNDGARARAHARVRRRSSIADSRTRPSETAGVGRRRRRPVGSRRCPRSSDYAPVWPSSPISARWRCSPSGTSS